MSHVRVGVVGTGGIARSRQIPCLLRDSRVALVAAADPSEEALALAASEGNIPSTYADYREMLEREHLDAVVVCTPNKFHAPVTIDALRQGAHVLCEKPMARNAEEARAMLKAAREHGKILDIAYCFRFQAEAQAAKRVIDGGELGEIYMVRVNFLRRRLIPSWGVFANKDLQGGGAMIDCGVHLLDLALWLCGNPEPVEVMGVTSHRLGSKPGVNVWGPWDHEHFEVEDHAAGFIRLRNGGALQIEASWALNVPQHQETISISGTEGGLDVYPFRVNKAAYGMLLDWTPDWMPHQGEPEWDRQMDDFISAIVEGREPLVKPEEALRVNEIVDAIYRSAETGAAVRLDA